MAGITALLAQLETQPTLPSLAVSIVADVAGYKRTMTCRSGIWDGYDLTHPFMDDRSTVVRGPSVLTAIEQEVTLRIPIAIVPMPQPLPPAHLVIQPQAQVHVFTECAIRGTAFSSRGTLCQCSSGPCATYHSYCHTSAGARGLLAHVQRQSAVGTVFCAALCPQ